MAKDSFVLYTQYRRDTGALTDTEMGRLFRAILDYVGEDREPDVAYLGPAGAMAFAFIRSRLDIDIGLYEDRCRQNAENGRKGGLAKARKRMAAVAGEAKQDLANLPDYEGDDDNVVDCDNGGVGGAEGLSPSFVPKIREWFAHKRERDGEQTSSAINAMTQLIRKQIDRYGEEAVAELIDYSIRNNYGSLYLDRLEIQERSTYNGCNGHDSGGGDPAPERYGTHL